MLILFFCVHKTSCFKFSCAGGPLSWGQQVRFRHMTTRQYLCSRRSLELYLREDATDPKTVFRLHPLLKVSERNVVIGLGYESLTWLFKYVEVPIVTMHLKKYIYGDASNIMQRCCANSFGKVYIW